MVELDQFKYTLSTYVPMLKELGASLNLDAKKERIAELSRYMEAPDFWDDPERSQKMTKELKSLEDTVKSYTTLSTQYDDISELIEMGYEENDPEVIPVIQESLDEFTTNLEALRLSTLLNGEYDKNNAIIRLNAGAGGTEACDWSSMLYRMYTRYADRNGFSVEVLDMLDGDEAGIKSVTFQVNGENAYGYLKSEKGVHRLVRISPFNAAGKRQTSLFPVMLCQRSRKILMLKSTMMIFVSILTVLVVPADSISIRHHLQFVLRIFRLVSLLPVRMSVPSSRIRTRQCRC